MKAPIRVGAVQTRILRVLWDHGEATARTITDELSQHAPIAHSTVQTLLRKLEAKGAVGHIVRERTFYFRPLVTSDQVVRSATRELLGRVFDGSAFSLVAHLVRHERITREELDHLRKLIDEAEKKP